MKNTVTEIIRILNKEELREFKYFLNRQNNHVHEREDLKVIDIIRNGEEDFLSNRQAFHQTKSRLKKQLELFASLENTRFENTSKIQGKIEMAKYLFRKGLYNHAWDYLFKAEKMALQAEEYEMLDYIYYIQISYSYNIAIPPPPAFSVPSLLEKRTQNLSSAKTDSDANAAYALLVHQLRETFAKKLHADIDDMIFDIFNQYGISDSDLYKDQLKIYNKIVNMVCRALREKRDYKALEEYSIRSYMLIKRKNLLDKMPVDAMLDLLDMICIGTLRSKDYINYEKYQQLYADYASKMQATSDEYSYYDFIPYIDAADLYMSTNRLDKARERLMIVEKKYASYTKSIRIYFLLRVNLIAMYFKYGDYKKCIGFYNEIIAQGDRKILSERGFRIDLILFTEIYGAIFYYERDDIDHAFYILSKLKRKYSDVLRSNDSGRENVFIKIMEKMLNDASYLKSEQFKEDCTAFIKFKEFVPGDNEYISLNAWLESKLTGKTYYECFLAFTM